MSIPLLLLVVVAYNAMALTGIADVAQPVLELRLVSGVRWSPTVGDLAVAAGAVLLAADILKAAMRRLDSRRSFLDPLLSLTLFAIVLLQFLLMPAFASSAFFILALLCLLDAGARILLAATTPPRRDREPF